MRRPGGLRSEWTGLMHSVYACTREDEEGVGLQTVRFSSYLDVRERSNNAHSDDRSWDNYGLSSFRAVLRKAAVEIAAAIYLILPHPGTPIPMLFSC